MGLYEKFDSTLMRGVNAGVRAWNWTTGKTRAELANNLELGGAVFWSIGVFGMNKVAGAIGVPLAALGTYGAAILNNKQDKVEAEALEKKALDPFAERRKAKHSFWGPAYATFSGLSATTKASSGYDGTTFAIAYGCFAASSYVMRAENLPPRKSVIARAADSLKEMMQQPVLQPVSVRINYGGRKND